MFHDLDKTIEKVLRDPQIPAGLAVLKNADIRFDVPDKNYPPAVTTSTAILNLYLYQTQENRVLRDPVPIIERVGGIFVRRKPPLRVDCSYMVTAWSKKTDQQKIEEEHQLLSETMCWLSRFPIIPEGRPDYLYLQGTLQNPPFPHRTEVALPNGDKNMGEFWTALGQPPRPSFNLLVTITLECEVQVPEGPPVITKDMRLSDKDKPATQERWFQIGGTVYIADSLPQALSGVQVRLVEKDQTVVTDEEGQFSFTQLVAGNYTLEVNADGFPPASKNIEVPAPPGSPPSADAYDVVLTPS